MMTRLQLRQSIEYAHYWAVTNQLGVEASTRRIIQLVDEFLAIEEQRIKARLKAQEGKA